jgi:predicted RNase H-like nuclease (RuvC/YqgF family)
MSSFRVHAEAFIDSLKQEIEECRKRLEPLEAGTWRLGERPYGGEWSDITDREISLLKREISSRQRTIGNLEKELEIRKLRPL